MKNTLVLLLLCLCGTSFLFAQNEKVEHKIVPVEPVVKSEVFTIVEDLPVYGDCKDVSNNTDKERCSMKNVAAFLENEISKVSTEEIGKVFVRFVIDENGNLIDAEVALSASENLNKLALEIVNKMQDWTPGMQRGKAVKVQYVVPVNFK